MGNPLDVFPGRQRLGGISPAIIMRDGRPEIALGTHGGYYISQTMVQMIMNLIDFDMNVQQAGELGVRRFRRRVRAGQRPRPDH